MKHHQHSIRLLLAWPVLLALLLPCSTAYAHFAAGIKFAGGDLQDVLKVANETGKYVFVHTTSNKCRPCSLFASDYYTDAEVSSFFNANFINYTLNIDQAGYGNFARMNNLGAETELLFYSSNGLLIDQASGSDIQSKKDLLTKGQNVLRLRSQDNWKKLEQLEQKYLVDPKSLNPNDRYNYAYLLRTFSRPYNKAVNEYIETQRLTEMTQAQNRQFVYDFADNLNNACIDYFLGDLAHFKTAMNGAQVNSRIKMAIQNTLTSVVLKHDSKLFDKMLAVAKAANLDDEERYVLNLKAEYYEKTNNWPELAKITKQQVSFNATDERLLNDAADRYCRFATPDNKADLKLAIQWAEKSVEIEVECYNTFTLAKLQNRIGNTDLAITTLQKCIEIGNNRMSTVANPADQIPCFNEAANLLDILSADKGGR